MARGSYRADTVAMMGRNHIGAVGVRRAEDRAARLQHGFHVHRRREGQVGPRLSHHDEPVAGKRSAGSLSWGGINNTYFWIDPPRGIAGVVMMQFLPFADTKALAIYDAFERGVYQLAR